MRTFKIWLEITSPRKKRDMGLIGVGIVGASYLMAWLMMLAVPPRDLTWLLRSGSVMAIGLPLIFFYCLIPTEVWAWREEREVLKQAQAAFGGEPKVVGDEVVTRVRCRNGASVLVDRSGRYYLPLTEGP